MKILSSHHILVFKSLIVNHSQKSLRSLKSMVQPQCTLKPSIHLTGFYSTAQYTQESIFQPKLSPLEVSKILKNNEHTTVLQHSIKAYFGELVEVPSNHAIYSVDSNQLASNTPIEDKLSKCKCLLTTGFLFGVFDGHGGPECSQVISKRLFDYIAASLLPRSELRRVVSELENGVKVELTQVYNDVSQFVPELQNIYDASFLRWCHKILDNYPDEFSMEDALSDSFAQLDQDISDEVVHNMDSSVFHILESIALSGSVACVAYIDGPHLHVANTGDCGAVIGSVAGDNHRTWVPDRITKDHNSENFNEVQRIMDQHPESESEELLRDNRLLGVLSPLRAFGDFRLKWSKELQMKVIKRRSSLDKLLLKLSRTPPYLTAKPEVHYFRLQPQQKFLILGSDGLWESMNSSDIVNLVGEYMSGRQTLQKVQFERGSVTLSEVSEVLRRRQEGLRLKPTDTNASTHLIRHCIGGSDEGLDHQRLSHSLSLPTNVRRYFRDDISIHVIFFNSEFLRHCPVELE